MDASDERRFDVRRGWLRNLRALTCDDDGITVHRWLAGEQLATWSEVQFAWRSHGVLELRAARHRWLLDERVSDLRGFCAHVTERLGEFRTRAVPAAAVLDWLGGYASACVTLPPAKPPGVTVSLTPAKPSEHVWSLLLMGVLFAVAAMLARHLDLARRMALPIAIDAILLLVASIVYVCLPGRRPRLFPSRRQRWPRVATGFTVEADGQAVRVRLDDASPVSMAWGALRQVVEEPEDWILVATHLQALRIPNRAEFAPVIQTALNVVRLRYGEGVDDEPVTDAAISRIGPADADGSNERSLSRFDDPA